MSSPPTIDLEPLTAPLEGDDPCGVSLKWESVFDEIKNARKQGDRDALTDDVTEADWAKVIDLCTEALRERSKDLMLAGWLTEALLEKHGFRGLRDGLRLINGLLDEMWETVHPRDEDGDLEVRAAPLVWLTDPNGGARLPSLIRAVELFPNGEDNGDVFSWSFWKARYPQPKGDSESEDAFDDRKAAAERMGERFEKGARSANVSIFEALSEDVDECRAELERFNQLVDAKLEGAAPGISGVRTALDDCQALVRRILKEKVGPELESEDAGEDHEGGDDMETAESDAPRVQVKRGPIRTREEAYRQLREVADFLLKTEPHSPVAFLLARASRWGEKNLSELLPELIKDDSVREQVGELLGIEEQDSDD